MLAVVGGVIGGIWVGARSVILQHQVNVAIAHNATIVQDMMRLFKGNQFPTVFTDLTQTAISAKIIPEDMINNGAAKHIWGGAYEIVVATSSTLRTLFYNTPKRACAKLVLGVTEGVTASGYSTMGISTVTVDAANILPALKLVSPETYISQVVAACNSATTSNIIFIYSLSEIR